jgi:LysR family transcriptional regulator, hydrogen peroxide-inducible genes activator
MISTQQVTYILAIADTGSFSRAAGQCFVTQPTLSMQIKKAEEQLGFPVFHRDTARIELSDFGKALIPILRQIQADFGAIERLREEFSGTFKERLRIGVIPTIACYLLQDCFSEWQELIPDTKLNIEEMKTEELLEALSARRIDLAILAGPVEAATWRSVPLYSEEICAYLPASGEKSVSVGSLRGEYPWLLSKGNCLRTQMMHFCSLTDDHPTSWNYAGGNIDMLMRMVDLKGGYTLVPANYCALFPEKEAAFKSITDDAGHHPGRSVMAVSAYRHANWESMEKIIRSVQLKYASESRRELELLSWK